MRKTAICLSILGIASLIFLFFALKPLTISKQTTLSNLNINQKIIVISKVYSEKRYDSLRVFALKSNITAICENCPSYLNKTIKITGLIDEYNSKKEIRITKIEVIN